MICLVLNCSFTFVYLIWHLCVWDCMCGCQKTLQELLLSFHHVGLRDRSHAVRLGDGHLYPPSHLAAPSPLASSDIFACVVVSSKCW